MRCDSPSAEKNVKCNSPSTEESMQWNPRPAAGFMKRVPRPAAEKTKRILRRAVPWLAAAALLLALGIVWVQRGGLLPDWWCERTLTFDLTGDGVPETLTLRRKALTVTDDMDRVLWKTERGWLAQDVLAGDIDGDGTPELLALVWKRGSYGYARPFWVERDETAFSQHIFIYRWDAAEERFRPLWMASALRPRVQSWALSEDGVLAIVTEAGEDTRWAWQGWGLTRIDAPLRPI